jgi:hypothetical protein
VVHVHPPDMPLGGDYWQGGFDIDVASNAPPPVWGVADTHAHPMSYLGMGGSWLWGKPDGGLDELGHCTPAHGVGGTGLFGTAGNILVAGIEGQLGHLVGGYPEFDGWPRFITTSHQQMHVDWIRRAVAGGLRLMVALVVNNRLLAKEFGDHDDGDSVQIDRQVDALVTFAAAHPDLMEVVGDPKSAREVINSGRLAVVPGVEVDALGDWVKESDATAPEVVAYLTHLVRDLGLRHFFPIHLTNNAFGGCAVYKDLFNAANHYARGDYYEVRDATADGARFRLGEDEGAAVGVLRAELRFAPPDYSKTPGGHGNARGLSPLGRTAVSTLMDLGAVIDTDHMSFLSMHETLEIAEARHYPVTAGHSAFPSLCWERDDETADVHKLGNEYMRTETDIARILALGGLVSEGLHQGDIRAHDAQVPNDAAGSSKSWAQAYLHATALSHGGPIALGTDMDGLAGSSGPRFGMNACFDLSHPEAPDEKRVDLRRDQVDAQANGVAYDRPVLDYRHYRFSGVLEGNVYSHEERLVWEAVAIAASATPPDEAEMPNVLIRDPWTAGKIRNLAKGFVANSEDQLDDPILGGNTHSEQLAAFRTASGQSPQPSDAAEVHRLFDVIARPWSAWQSMTGDNAPLQRNIAGRRDFDVNLDGVAHYGLLPDFFQDLRNVGLSTAQLAPLFSSAEGYLRMWERCEEAAERAKRSLPATLSPLLAPPVALSSASFSPLLAPAAALSSIEILLL